MDGRQFDAFSKQLAIGASRRTLLKGALLGAFSLKETAGAALAQGQPADPCAHCPIGAGCYPDNPRGDCCPLGETLCCGVCVLWGPDINAQNCTGDACVCRQAGQLCLAGISCCGEALCDEGSGKCVAGGSDTACDQCPSGTSCCEGGTVCVECCAAHDCGEGFACVNGACKEVVEDPCAECPSTAGPDCYPDNPYTSCCPPDFGLCCGLCMPWGPDIIRENCTGSACICRSENMTCDYGIACCDGLACDTGSGRCVGGCVPAWHPCGWESDCCHGLVCEQETGVCKERASCHGPSETCSSNSDCCPGYQCEGGYCSAPKGCIEQGYACHPKLPCCQGLECNGHTCETPPTPPYPTDLTPAGGATFFPNTGAGPKHEAPNWFGLAVLGSAAAVAARIARNGDTGSPTSGNP